jgi:hypothetical protein
MALQGCMGHSVAKLGSGLDDERERSLTIRAVYGLLKNSLIIHEENTKEITGVKESVYYAIEIHVDLHKL